MASLILALSLSVSCGGGTLPSSGVDLGGPDAAAPADAQPDPGDGDVPTGDAVRDALDATPDSATPTDGTGDAPAPVDVVDVPPSDLAADVPATDVPADAGSDAASDAFPEALQPSDVFKYAEIDVPASWLDSPPECRATDWLGKYFRYRMRLRGDGTAQHPGFVSIGEAPGQSLLMGLRDPTLNCTNSYWTEGCEIQAIADANGSYGLGDGTIWLGLYIATIATEHKVFSMLGLPTAQTESDLYYALMAFNRLDRSADAWYGINDASALNGFFQRQDVPADFVWTDASHTAYRFPRADGGLNGYGCMETASSCHPGQVPGIDSGFFESQDQVIRMQFGLAMVSKLVPDAVTVQGVSLRHEARAINDRMLKYLRDHAWDVRDPNGNKPSDEWGGSALFFSNAIAKCGNVICGDGCEDDFGIDDYRDATSQTLGTLGLAGDDLSWFAQTSTNINMGLMLATCGDQWDADKLEKRSINYGAAIFPLALAILHDYDVPASALSWRMDEMLTSAPCNGPCHGTPGCEEVPGWRGDDRWRNPEKMYYGVNRAVGEFNGYDYMLLHNLYFIARQGLFEYLLPDPGTSLCKGYKGLDRLIAEGPADGDSFDPTDPCSAADMQRTFCGRKFVRWLDEAYKGSVAIRLGDALWECEGSAPCNLVPEDGGKGDDGVDLMIGTDADDEFDGNAGDDCIVGNGGNDRLMGGQGVDFILGGPGNDEIFGESSNWIVLDGGNDLLFGGDGDDLIHGNPGMDALFGGAGADELYGDTGDDYLEGGDGDDRLRGDAGSDILMGGEGNDRMDGDAGDDHLKGGPGDDFLRGSSGDDSVVGDDGCDTLCGCSGADSIWGNWSGCTSCRYGSCTWLGADGGDTVNANNGCTTTLESYDDCNADI